MKTTLAGSREKNDSMEMMNDQDKRPFRWKMWLLIVLMPSLLWLDHVALFSSLEHRVVQIMIVLVVYGLMLYWLVDHNDPQ